MRIFEKIVKIKASGLLKKCDAIFVNDHSSDFAQGELDVRQATGVKYISLPPGVHGKKQAITHGVKESTSRWILTNDTDSDIDIEIIEHIPGEDASAKLIVLPIKPKGGGNGFAKLFALEFMILQGVGLAFAKWGYPVLANGAGLLVHREAFIHTLNKRYDWELEGGDDIFTTLAVRKHFGPSSIDALITKHALIETSFDHSFSALWKQRVRWISKVPSVNNFLFGALAWFVLLANAVASMLLLMLVLDPRKELAALLMLKWIPEVTLAAWGVLYFRRLDCALWTWPALLLYPIYLPFLALTAVLWKPRWKY